MIDSKKPEPQVCGIVMPISAIDGCDERHWLDVKEIIFKSVLDAEMTPQLVSDDVEVGIIQKRIVQNLYENPVVICDVSAKNPNVMLELGMRLAFDKPVIVVKDDQTNYSFDSSPIEHLTYPRDLRYQSVLGFQVNLRDKILAMQNGKNENSFLKSFGTFKTSKLEHVEGTPLDVVLDELKFIGASLRHQQIEQDMPEGWLLSVKFIPSTLGPSHLSLTAEGPQNHRSRFIGALKAMHGVMSVQYRVKNDFEDQLDIRTAFSKPDPVRQQIIDLLARRGVPVSG